MQSLELSFSFWKHNQLTTTNCSYSGTNPFPIYSSLNFPFPIMFNMVSVKHYSHDSWNPGVHFPLDGCFLITVPCLTCPNLMYIWKPPRNVSPVSLMDVFCLFHFHMFPIISAVSYPGCNWLIKISFSRFQLNLWASITENLGGKNGICDLKYETVS